MKVTSVKSLEKQLKTSMYNSPVKPIREKLKDLNPGQALVLKKNEVKRWKHPQSQLSTAIHNNIKHFKHSYTTRKLKNGDLAVLVTEK